MSTSEKIEIQPFITSGTISAPASKSAMQRALALALLNTKQTTICNPGTSNDDVAALGIIKQLGASVESKSNTLIVKGVENFNGTELYAGESGLSIRMFTPIAALSAEKMTMSGSGSLMQRPMQAFEDVFHKIGVQFSSNNGKLPFEIKGNLVPQDIEMDGSLSSQFLTGFLIAFARAATKNIIIKVSELKSTPYIDLTLKMMKWFGYDVINEENKIFHIAPKAIPDKDLVLQIEGDWSGASFLLVAGAIGGEIIVKGLSLDSVQGDKKIMEALQDAGAQINATEDNIQVKKNELKAFHFDATDCPDLFPPLVALAACCAGESVIKGISRLTHKESNRAETLKQEFEKLGVPIRNVEDQMYIQGNQNITGGNVSSCNDHRIAMAMGIMASVSRESIFLEGADAVNKSYPDFFKDLDKLKTKN